MVTSEDTLRNAQSKTIEEAGSRSNGVPDTPTRKAKIEDKEIQRRKKVSDIPVDEGEEEAEDDVPRLASLPEIPTGDDLKFDFEFMKPASEVEEKVNKRASNVLKLTQENEKLQAQLKAMAEQLETMERLRAQLAAKEQKK